MKMRAAYLRKLSLVVLGPALVLCCGGKSSSEVEQGSAPFLNTPAACGAAGRNESSRSFRRLSMSSEELLLSAATAEVGLIDADSTPDLLIRLTRDEVGNATRTVVLLGNPDGNWSQIEEFQERGAIRLIDVNHDGRQDLSVGSRYRVAASDGKLGEPEPFPTEGTPLDFNQDGVLDFLESGNPPFVRVGLSEGGFSESPSENRGDETPAFGFLSRISYTRLRIGRDTNGDGLLDLIGFDAQRRAMSLDGALLDDGPAQVAVRFGEADGSFRAIEHLVLSVRGGRQPDEGIRSLAQADLNCDGRADLVLLRPGRLEIRLRENAGWAEPIAIVGESPIQVLTGDFDGDGNHDLVTNWAPTDPVWGDSLTDEGVVDVRFGAGDGTFSEPVELTIGGQAVRGDLLAVGDLNLDGAEDILASVRVDGQGTLVIWSSSLP